VVKSYIIIIGLFRFICADNQRFHVAAVTRTQLPSCTDADNWVTVTRVLPITGYRQCCHVFSVIRKRKQHKL